MKKLLKLLGFSLLSIIVFVLLYFGAAWLFSRLTVKAEPGQRADVFVYLKTNGVHTDIVLPVHSKYKDWSRDLSYKDVRSGDSAYNYLAFGWGSKEFYLETPTWADLKWSTALKAASGLGQPAIHVTYYYSLQENENCVRFGMGEEQYLRLVNYIEQRLVRDENGKPLVISTEARYGNNDAFYEAKGRYTVFYTCNTWTNSALKASGQKACWWTPFDWGLMYQYGK